MKKAIIIVGIFSGLLNVANAAQLSVASMPDGLKNGYFSINCTYTNGYFAAEGPVTNWGNYGLQGSINSINGLLADKDLSNFKLRVRLYCQNNSSANYFFDSTQLKEDGNILINPPENCA